MQALMPYLLPVITAILQEASCAPVNENPTSTGRAGLTPDGISGLAVNIIGLFLTAFGVLAWMRERRSKWTPRRGLATPEDQPSPAAVAAGPGTDTAIELGLLQPLDTTASQGEANTMVSDSESLPQPPAGRTGDAAIPAE